MRDALVIPLALEEVARTLGATLAVEGRITGVTLDSRSVRPGDCFVALKGSRCDARHFIPDALAAGAALAIGGPGTAAGPRVLAVADPLAALESLARLVRDRHAGPVLGITGTAGKTTVKELLRQLLPEELRGVFPEASFNNREGVARTLTRIEPDTGVVVVEIGTNAPGEIAALCRLARPTMGLITSIGAGHLEGLKSVAGVLEEKLDLARALPAGATLFVNADDPVLAGAAFPAGLRLVRLGLEARAGVIAPPASGDPSAFVLGDGTAVRHPFATQVHRRNLWIALNVALELGAPPAALAGRAPALVPARMRGEQRDVGRSRVVVDCYNANPLSMRAALEDLVRLPGPHAAVLGEMLELGEETASRHEELGRLVRALGIAPVIFIGPSGPAVLAGARAAGAPAGSVRTFPSIGAARAAFAELVAAERTLLLKGSRGMQLERLLPEGRDG